MKELQFDLKEPLEYSTGGSQSSSQFIVLHAPTSKHRKECAELKQAFFRAVNDIGGDAEAPADKKDPTGEDVMMMIAMSRGADLHSVLETSRRLFTGGVALVGGEERLTSALIDRMSLEDLERMTGEYLVFFLLSSALEKMKGR